MKYTAFENQHNPGEWCVEAQDSRGEFLLTLFIGPFAKDRAEEYAVWQTARNEPSHHTASDR
jgi:hypothetical protein